MLRQQQNKQQRQFASAALFVLATLFATFVLSCAQEEKKAPAPRARRTGTGSTITAAKPQIDPATAVAVIETAKGTIEFEFLATEAPETSKNFIKNAQVMYYKGEKFNRAEELLIQAGSKLAAGETLPIENGAKEMSRGVVAMAKEEGASVSYASEFFICRDSTILDSDYTIFGNVISGMDVVDNIAVDDVITNITIRNKE
ncbi:peptidylprolyl isomerase [Candidatus Poribacteria bacterium]|nr:peptidylprolyl isomerase [Candidatus Poribacteria bacterium]MYG05466.1 peptidylprolyl isomerase [Candidatus Poribacteria bacterium]MYK23043.1 peptidylprolyl isomerase [Candidatus Poribacteria bacterium]